MSEMSEKARKEGKEKVKRLTGDGPPASAVDASNYGEAPCGFLHTEKKLGNRPISKQNLACGGKASHKHAGRKGRQMGGPMSEAGSQYVANVPAPPQNRFSFTGNQSPFLAAAGMKKGGGIKIKKSHEGLLHKELGVSEGKKIPEKKLEKAADSSNPAERKRAVFAENAKKWHHKAKGGEVGQNPEIEGTRPVGGRIARKSGGATKKGTTVNIIIAQKPEHPQMPMGGPPGMPPKPPMPMPPVGPQGAPAGPMPGGPNMPPPSMQPPMGRASGGKVYPDMDYAAGGGKGRLEKIRKYGI